MQELVDALVTTLPPDRVRTNAPVRRLNAEAARWIIATPAYVAADLLGPIDPEVANLCRTIRYVSSGIAVLAYPRDRVGHSLSGSGFVVPRTDRSVRIIAATWLSSKWPGRAPAGVALMRAFFGGARDLEAMALEDGALVELAHRDLAHLLDISTPPTFSRVYRWVNGTPQYEVGYLDTLAEIRRRTAGRRIQLIGAGFGTIGIPDCIAAGRAAARAALI
jgi:oxygen-dependent protoporphyrinogen oxidase